MVTGPEIILGLDRLSLHPINRTTGERGMMITMKVVGTEVALKSIFVAKIISDRKAKNNAGIPTNASNI